MFLNKNKKNKTLLALNAVGASLFVLSKNKA
jgi:hypothetical protein